MREIIVDNFAGGGGASTGIELATGRSVDVAINHDPAAIAMHRANHPATKHYTEDIWKVDPVEVCGGRPVGLAWFSPDCKHFSRAKGGKPVSKKIRGLAWVAVKWAKAVRPRVIMLENVEEFQEWGRLDDEGRPDPRYKGETFRRFVGKLEQLGYRVEYRLLRACDYGAPTIRKRFFLVARCDGKRIVWPETEYGAPDSLEVFSGLKKPWKPVADVLDFSLPCPSIFDSSEEIWKKYRMHAVRPLAEATMRRIARGVQKFVLENPRPFIIRYKFDNDPEDSGKPLSTVTTVNSHYLAVPSLIQYHDERGGGVRGQDVESPLMTVDASNRYGLVEPFLAQIGYGEREGQQPRVMDVQKPLNTIVAQSNKFAECSVFIDKYCGGQNASSGADKPLPTAASAERDAVCAVAVTQFNNHCDGQEVTKPLGTMTAQSNHFGEVRAFLVKYYGGDGINAAACDEPAPTITTKDRMGLVTVQGQDYQIVDIGMRMLTPRELFSAQGFPDSYIIDVDADGNEYPRSEQVARCGNAVCPPVPAALVRSNLPELCEAG